MKTNFRIDEYGFEINTDASTHNLIHNKTFRRKDICEYITKTLKYAGIHGVLATELLINYIEFRVSIYTFIRFDSVDIIHPSVKIPEHLKGLIHDTRSPKPSKRLHDEMLKFCDPQQCETIKVHDSGHGTVIPYFKCDIIKVLYEYSKTK